MPSLLLLLTLLIPLLPLPASAAFTCTTVVMRNDLDPTGFPFSNRFSDHLDVNASGDVVFAARALAARQRLYVYPAVGSPEILAEGAASAPAGHTFKKRPVSHVSLNDAGDVVFLGGLEGVGSAILARRDAAPLEIAVLPGDGAPTGGFFDQIHEAAPVNASGVVAFVATTSLGTKSVFTHDLDTSLTAVAVAEGAAVDFPFGRSLCTIRHVDLSDSGDLAIRANSRSDCNDPSEIALQGVYHVGGGTITRIAMSSDPSPIPATVYDDVYGVPKVNAVGEVVFTSRLDGATRRRGLFLWDGATTTNEVFANDVSTVTGGVYKTFSVVDLSNDGHYVVASRYKGGGHKQAIVDHGPVASELVVGRGSTPPSDRFAVGAEYRSFGKKHFGMSTDGTQVVVRAKVKDVVVPKAKSALIRCSS